MRLGCDDCRAAARLRPQGLRREEHAHEKGRANGIRVGGLHALIRGRGSYAKVSRTGAVFFLKIVLHPPRSMGCGSCGSDGSFHCTDLLVSILYALGSVLYYCV
jgi:hypothetical protein